jgi:plastocyanin
MNTRRLRIIALIAVAALGTLLLAGCGDSSSASEPVETNEVNLPPSYKFEPKVIQVTAGTTVTWTNNDHFTHSVEMDGQPDHKIAPGESVEITFDTPGTYDYTCTLHPHDMSGTVIVVSN